MQFPGFTEADFDAYRPERASSHAFNRPRLEAKQKALSLGRELLERAVAQGTTLEVRASDEHPSLWNGKSVTSQWVFFWRDGAARRQLESILAAGKPVGAALSDPTPFFRHAFLALFLDATLLEMTFKIHGNALVDMRNLRALCDDPARRASLVAILNALPADFRVGVTQGPAVGVRDVDDASLVAILAACVESSQWWYVGRAVERAAAVALGASVAGTLQTAFDALLPVYSFVAWSHENDLGSIERELVQVRAERAAHVSEDAAREAAWRAQHEAEILRRREAAVVEARERAAGLEPARPAAVHAAVQAVIRQAEVALSPGPRADAPSLRDRRDGLSPIVSPRGRDVARARAIPPDPAARSPGPSRDAPGRSPPVRDAAAKVQPSAAGSPRVGPSKAGSSKAGPSNAGPSAGPSGSRSSVLVESEVPVVLGAQVRVRTGPFAGRVGTVTELDGRGHVKVTFGQLSARLVTEEVVTLAEV